MDKVLIAGIEVEGGGVKILGKKSESVWSFWTEGTSMDLDENHDEVWRSWSSEPVSSLDLVVPEDWPMFHPSKIHPDFLDWFRANYDKVRAMMPKDQRRVQEKYRHKRWLEVLDMPR